MIANSLRIYLAAPFFSQSERQFNDRVVQELETAWDVFYPYRDGLRMSDLVGQRVSATDAARQVWLCDYEQIRGCDLVVAVLDGRVPDEGVCVEIGLAKGFGKTVIGLLTDSRNCFPWGANPMVTACLSQLCTDSSLLVAMVRQCFEAKATSHSV